ncbi:MAG: 5'-nucleotidase C-terminal domain-containing protein [Pyrinomonadaceae bacterium]
MKTFIERNPGEGLRRLLLLLIVVWAGATASLAQPAAKPKRSSAQTGGADIHARVTETLIDASISDDPAVDKMVAVYAPKVRELDNVIGKLRGDLHKGGVGASSLGNFVTDGVLAEARAKVGNSVVLAITNAGGLRKSAISEGELRQRDIFELLPFENALVEFDLTGAQVLSVLKQVVSHRDAQSGARIKYVNDANNRPQFESARLLIDGREREIDPAAIYKVVSIDYLWKRSSTVPSDTEGNYSVLSQAKKIEPLGLTIRDAIIHYVKAETAAGRDIKANMDNRFMLDNSVAPEPQEERQ